MRHWAKTLLKVQLTLAAFLAAPVASAATFELTPEPNPPEAGTNQLTLKISDEAGKPIEGAKVDVQLYMPAMGAMPRMEERATVKDAGDGRHVVEYDLSMGGTWEMTVTAEVEGKQEVGRYSITTGIPGVADKGARSKPTGGTKSTDGVGTSVLDLGPERLQRIGVRFASAEPTVMSKVVEAVGVVEQDQTHREEVVLRFPGYVVKQFRGRVGDSVKKGEPLFSVYSPELVAAQSEYLIAGNQSETSALRQAAGERLRNLGLSEADLAQIRKSGKPMRDVVVRAPITGTVLEVQTREGASLAPGQVLYVVGDLSRTYIVARVFQQDVQDLKVGQVAELRASGGGGQVITGKIDLIYPQVEQGTGTANVRIAADEYLPTMRPGLYMQVRFSVPLGSRLAVPSEAILYSGRHRYVFVDHGDGVLEPREVTVGKTASGMTEILSGLVAGERVAASGTFLLGSEAQLRSALPKWAPSHQGHP